MAPHGEAIVSDNGVSIPKTNKNFVKPPRLSNDNLQRTVSDISFEFSKELAELDQHDMINSKHLPPISEIEDAKCECCGLSEEYTPEYVEMIRNKFCGKWICGLCAEAVKEEMEKADGDNVEEALSAHMKDCSRFNKYGRAFPVLLQAEAMREMLKRSSRRAKSISPKTDQKASKGGIARSCSCIPVITEDIDSHSVNQ